MLRRWTSALRACTEHCDNDRKKNYDKENRANLGPKRTECTVAQAIELPGRSQSACKYQICDTNWRCNRSLEKNTHPEPMTRAMEERLELEQTLQSRSPVKEET